MKHLILLTLALVSLASAADKPAHLFILTGQSNMAGMDPKLGFEPEAKIAFPDADVAYIKVAVGGMPISSAASVSGPPTSAPIRSGWSAASTASRTHRWTPPGPRPPR